MHIGIIGLGKMGYNMTLRLLEGKHEVVAADRFTEPLPLNIVADGTVTLKEMEEHFDAIMVADAMPYAKLFDATLAEPIYSDDDVMTMGARLSAYTATVASGPLAVVGLSESLHHDLAARGS